MIKSFVTTIWIIAFIATSCFASDSVKQQKVKFHPPDTEAERVLDEILKINNNPGDIESFVTDNEFRRKLEDSNLKLAEYYYSLVTDNFIQYFSKKLVIEMQDYCDSLIQDGIREPCDYHKDINFITGGQDTYNVYFFYTIKQTEDTAIISILGRNDINDSDLFYKPNPDYRLIKVDGKWKLDEH